MGAEGIPSASGGISIPDDKRRSEVRQLARAYDIVLYGLRNAAADFDDDRWSELRTETHKSRERVRVAMRAELGI